MLSAAQRREFTMNSFVKIMAMMPSQKRYELVARFYANGLRAFTQLAVIRFWTMERQRSEMRHPEAFRNRRSSWQGLGYEWWLESDDYEEEGAPVRRRPPKPKRADSIVFDDSSSDSRSGSSTETEPVMVRKVSPPAPTITGQQGDRKAPLQTLVLPPALGTSEPDPEEEVDIPLPTTLETPVGNITRMVQKMTTDAKEHVQGARAAPGGHRLAPLPKHLASQLGGNHLAKMQQASGGRNDSHTPYHHSVDIPSSEGTAGPRSRVREDVELIEENGEIFRMSPIEESSLLPQTQQSRGWKHDSLQETPKPDDKTAPESPAPRQPAPSGSNSPNQPPQVPPRPARYPSSSSQSSSASGKSDMHGSDMNSGSQGKNVNPGNAHVDVAAGSSQGGGPATPQSAASPDVSNVTHPRSNQHTSIPHTSATHDFALTSFPPFPSLSSDHTVAEYRRRSENASSDSASTTSSSSSSRARRALAFKLNNKAGAWSPQVSKASASTSIPAMTPHHSKENNPPAPARGGGETAEEMTRRISRSGPSPLRVERSRRRSTTPSAPVQEDEQEAISPTSTSQRPTLAFPSYPTGTMPRQTFGSIWQNMGSYPFASPNENERPRQATEQRAAQTMGSYRPSSSMSTPHTSPEFAPSQSSRSTGRKRSGAISSPEGGGANDMGKPKNAGDDDAPVD